MPVEGQRILEVDILVKSVGWAERKASRASSLSISVSGFGAILFSAFLFLGTVRNLSLVFSQF